MLDNLKLVKRACVLRIENAVFKLESKAKPQKKSSENYVSPTLRQKSLQTKPFKASTDSMLKACLNVKTFLIRKSPSENICHLSKKP